MGARSKVWVALALALLWSDAVWPGETKTPPPAPVPPEPPILHMNAVITEVCATGAVVGELAKFDMNLKAESLTDGLQRVRLFTMPVAISEVRTAGIWSAARLVRSPEGIDILLDKKGKHELTITFVQMVTGTKKEPQIVLPIPLAVKSTITLTIPAKDIEVKVEPEMSLETKPLGAATLVILYGGTANQVTLRWLPKTPEKKVEALVFATQSATLRLTRGTLHIETTIDYAIVQGNVDKFRIAIPEKYNLLSLECKDMRTWEVEGSGDKRIARIDLIGEADKTGKVSLKLEQPLENLPVTFDVPRIEPLDVARESGHLAVAVAKGLQVEPKELKDVSQVDVRELPAELQKEGGGLALGFHYLKRPFSLTLTVGEVVAKISAETFTNVRASLESLRITFTIKYTIRDAGVFSFHAQIPPSLRLVDVQGENINNWQVEGQTLRVDLRAKAENQYELRLEAEADVKTPQSAELPVITLTNVERERGFVTVSGVPGMRVDVARLDGINQMDVKDLPPEAGQKEEKPDLAFRYIKPGYKLALNITPVAPEIEAVVQSLITVDEKELTMQTQIDYTIRRAGLFQIKVKVPHDLKRQAVEGKDVDDECYDESSEVLTVSLRQKQEGQYSLKLSTQKEITDLLRGLDVPVIGTIDTKKERGFVALRCKASYRLKRAEGKVKGLDEIDVSELPQPFFSNTADIALAFKYFSPPWSLSLTAEKVEPRVIAEVFNFVTIGENLMQMSATAKYDILHAGVDTFKLKFPDDVTNVDIDGENIKRRDQDKKSNTWTITLQAKKMGQYRLYATFQKKIEKKNTPLAYTGIQALDVERETGFVAVASRADVEVTLPEKGIENLTPIDEREIPREYMQGITLPILMAFKYIEQPYVLKLESRTNDPAEVTVAVIESCKLETTVTVEGNMISDFVAYVRNSRQQYMEFVLPEKAEIWHAFVDGQPVTPFQEKRTEGKASVTVTKLPIARAGRSQEAFEVRLRYSTKVKPLWYVGTVDLECPRTNIGIMRLGWTLALPKGYTIIRDAGNLTRIESPQYFEYQLQSISADVSYSEMKRVTVASQLEASKPSQNNAQTMANIRAIQQLEQQKAAGADGTSRVSSMQSIYTGKKPDLPNKFHYQCLILSTDKPARIYSQYVKTSVGIPAGVLLVALIAWFSYAGWRRSVWTPGAKFAVLIVIAIIALGARTLGEGSFSAIYSIIFWTTLCAALILGIADLIKAIREARGVHDC